MIRPLEAFIARRYVFSGQAGFFVSFMTWVSMLGVGLGVWALITILSVMNGFEAELRGRLLSLSAHATVTAVDGRKADWAALTRRLETGSAVPLVGVAPYIELQALLSFGSEMSGAIVRGIDPRREGAVSAIAGSMLDGTLEDLQPGSDRVILGRALANQVGAGVGDSVTLLIPRGDERTGEITPRIRSFTVSGIFEVGLQDHDSVLALVHLDDARAFEGAATPGSLTGLRLRFADPLQAPAYAQVLAALAGPEFRVRDWTVENAAYFRAIRIEKTMMTLIMLLIVAVAAFNIVAMLVMVVRAKRTDIAILRTLGLTSGNVLGIFVAQGLVIGWSGAVAGIVTGLLTAYNVDHIVPWLERLLGFHIMDADVYYITRIPSEPHALDVVVIAVAAFIVTLLATLYPARRAARTQPAEALRYE